MYKINIIKVWLDPGATVKLSKFLLQYIRFGSVASFLTETSHQGNPDRYHKPVSIGILHMHVLLECCYIYKWKVHNGKIEIISFVKFKENMYKINIIKVWLDPGSNPRFSTLEESRLTITPQMRSINWDTPYACAARMLLYI
jgi:hypothetical protein